MIKISPKVLFVSFLVFASWQSAPAAHGAARVVDPEIAGPLSEVFSEGSYAPWMTTRMIAPAQVQPFRNGADPGQGVRIAQAETPALSTPSVIMPEPGVLQEASTLICGEEDKTCTNAVVHALNEWFVETVYDAATAPQSSEALSALFRKNMQGLGSPEARIAAFKTLVDDNHAMGSLRERLRAASIDSSLKNAGADILSGIAFGLFSAMVTEQLAQHYEANGHQRAASATRTGFAPLAQVVVATVAGSTGGLVAANVSIWSRNVHSMAVLGGNLNEDRAAGRDVASQIEKIRSDMASIQQSLYSNRLQGSFFPDENQNDPLTDRHRAVLETILEDYTRIEDDLISADRTLNEGVSGWIASMSRGFAKILDGLSTFPEASDQIYQTTPSLPSDLRQGEADGDADAGSNRFFGIPGLEVSTDQDSESALGSWRVYDTPETSLSAGQSRGAFAFGRDGSVSVNGSRVFGSWEAGGVEQYVVEVFQGPATETAAVLFRHRDFGAMRLAVVNLESGRLSTEVLDPISRWGPPAQTAWSSDGSHVALIFPSGEFSSALGIIDTENGGVIFHDPASTSDALVGHVDISSIRGLQSGRIEVFADLAEMEDFDGVLMPGDTRRVRAEVRLPEETISDEPDNHFLSSLDGPSGIVVTENVFKELWGCGRASQVTEWEACFAEAGVSPVALDFARRIDEKIKSPGVATDVQVPGRYAIVDLLLPLRGNRPGATVLIDEDMNILQLARLTSPVEATVLSATRTLAPAGSTGPNTIIGPREITGYRALPGGDERYVVGLNINNGCNACTVGKAFVAVDFSPHGGAPKTKLLGHLDGGSFDVYSAAPPSYGDFSRSVGLVQVWLSRLGFEPGIADGVAGPATTAAVREFQREYCIAETARLETATLNALSDSDGIPPECGAAQILERLSEGAWSGSVSQPSSLKDYSMRVRANGNILNVDYPELSCGGIWEISELRSGVVMLRERIKYGHDKCTQNGFIFLRNAGNDRIRFEYRRRANGVMSASAYLTVD